MYLLYRQSSAILRIPKAAGNDSANWVGFKSTYEKSQQQHEEIEDSPIEDSDSGLTSGTEG